MNAPRRLLLSPRAAADLEEIAEYIARDNPRRAATFVAELEAKCRAVAETPEFYPARPDLAPGLRLQCTDDIWCYTAICLAKTRSALSACCTAPATCPGCFRPASGPGIIARSFSGCLPALAMWPNDQAREPVERGNDDRVQRDDQPVGFRAHRSPPQKPAPSPNLTAPPEPPAHSS